MRMRRLVVASLLTVSCVPTQDARPLGPGTLLPADPQPSRPAAIASPDAFNEGGARQEAHGLPAPGRYDLSQARVFAACLRHVHESYYDKTLLEPKRMLLGALEFVQREVPEILIESTPAQDSQRATVRIHDQQRVFPIGDLDSPWKMLATMKKVFAFIQPNVRPNLSGVVDAEGDRRLLALEVAATNGMLNALDSRSALLDVERYKEMRGGSREGAVGVVIRMDSKGRIVVKRSMSGSPGSRAGIQTNDRIVRIDDDVVANMTLDDVVTKLRGPVDSHIDVYVERGTDRTARKMSLTRNVFYAPTIDPPARVLTIPATEGQAAAKVGYLHLLNFASNSFREVDDVLRGFERKGLKGIILDLRGNEGGLYEQGRRVADAFIDSGTLVSMVGPGGKKLDDEVATMNDHTPKVPVVVLVDHRSAAAAEIVAGAMKNLNRAIVLGERTAGAGSVQILVDVRSPIAAGDMLGLRLTVAHFLSAGDQEIHGVGIVPDIDLTPLFVHKRGEPSSVRLQPPKFGSYAREPDGRSGSGANPSAGKPTEMISYLAAPAPLDDDEMPLEESDIAPRDPRDRLGSEEAAGAPNDFATEFASQILSRAKTNDRKGLLAESREVIAKTRETEERRLSAALGQVGVDWSAGPAAAPAQLEFSLRQVGAEGAIAAGHSVTVRGTVKNVGAIPAYRVRAVLASDDLLFDEDELVFGMIAPGATRTYDVTKEIPASWLTRTDRIRATLVGQGAQTAAELTLNIEEKARPVFDYTYQIIDDQKASHHEAQVQRGERLRLLVTVKNIGTGTAPHPEVWLVQHPKSDGVVIRAERSSGEGLAPGATRTFSFVYDVRPDFADGQLRLLLNVADRTFGAATARAIVVPIAPSGTSPAPSAVERVVAPALTVEAPKVTTAKTVHVTGTATDHRLVRDVFIRVWNRAAHVPISKTFYKANQATGDRTKMTFEADVPVWPGSNLLFVVARASDETQSVQMRVVLARAAP